MARNSAIAWESESKRKKKSPFKVRGLILHVLWDTRMINKFVEKVDISQLESARAKVLQSCLILCDLVDRSQTGSSVHGIFQVRILEWVAISFSRGSSPTRDRICISLSLPAPGGRFFTISATWEA